MKLEDQVTSLELSKKLKEIGVKQESLFYWVDNEKWSDECQLEYIPELEFPRDENSISAFTVAELGELFPSISSAKIGGEWMVMLKGQWISPDPEMSKTEVEFRGRILLNILERNIRMMNEAI